MTHVMSSLSAVTVPDRVLTGVSGGAKLAGDPNGVLNPGLAFGLPAVHQAVMA